MQLCIFYVYNYALCSACIQFALPALVVIGCQITFYTFLECYINAMLKKRDMVDRHINMIGV